MHYYQTTHYPFLCLKLEKYFLTSQQRSFAGILPLNIRWPKGNVTLQLNGKKTSLDWMGAIIKWMALKQGDNSKSHNYWHFSIFLGKYWIIANFAGLWFLVSAPPPPPTHTHTHTKLHFKEQICFYNIAQFEKKRRKFIPSGIFSLLWIMGKSLMHHKVFDSLWKIFENRNKFSVIRQIVKIHWI